MRRIRFVCLSTVLCFCSSVVVSGCDSATQGRVTKEMASQAGKTLKQWQAQGK